MEQHQNFQMMSARPRLEKADLAERYLVGIRTVENWLTWKIINGSKESGKSLFDPEECDRRLFSFSQSNVSGKDKGSPLSCSASSSGRILRSVNSNPAERRVSPLANPKRYYASTN